MTSNTIEISLSRSEPVGLGFNIKGGVDNPQVPGDSGIFVAKIREGGSAAKDQRLQEGDKILEVNGTSLECVTHLDAVNTFINAGNTVNMKVIPGALQARKEAYAKREFGPESTSKRSKGLPWLKMTIGLAAVAAISFAGFRLYKSQQS